MSKKVAVILSGSGVFDGSEIHEAVLTLLSLDRLGASYQCFAPDIPQHHVINHVTGEEMDEGRSVLVEAARIARGEIRPLGELKAEKFDALILPGGFGAAKNLSDFAFSGSELKVQSGVSFAVKSFSEAEKPVGLMCIAPAIAGRIFGEGVLATIGNDAETAAALEQTGVKHVECAVDDIVVDDRHKLVTTPAYMIARSISEAAEGIDKLVDRVLSMV
ncbi:isoprenoid biosynthesis glyoxalase ElbB [Endozoicomonas sp. 8E]|uniref:isoprenoid biosynthesis glyoxalase ElbB n=1 Tax=Endozoicomonas sp. 8E TaxID=3035692 RepID=UPI002938F8D3|nr:isoprenoid biosynthesis glyoxalase ElbB [Endozoicomonas sp. 8E]WOG27582.1 isoprenoid biosynthesis glyoxalase ElbB [Endozoicomonas sp. 8E]